MPNRILKESICTSENLNDLSAFEETFFYRLIVNVDDYGRMDARPKILASRLFPLKDIRAKQVDDALRALSSAELIDLYVVDGKSFLQMKAWDRHQTPRAKTSKYPGPEESVNTSASICMQMQADENMCNQMQADAPDIRYSIFDNRYSDSRTNRESGARDTRFTPPSLDDVAEYCRERKNNVDPEAFVNFYASKGWMVGKNHMKDWRAAVRTWERERGGSNANANGSTNIFAQIQEQERRGYR